MSAMFCDKLLKGFFIQSDSRIYKISIQNCSDMVKRLRYVFSLWSRRSAVRAAVYSEEILQLKIKNENISILSVVFEDFPKYLNHIEGGRRKLVSVDLGWLLIRGLVKQNRWNLLRKQFLKSKIVDFTGFFDHLIYSIFGLFLIHASLAEMN